MNARPILLSSIHGFIIMLAAGAPVMAQQASAAATTQTAPADTASAPTSQPASQPASTPAEETNPLPSPARMMQYFESVLTASAEDETQINDALICLNFSQVDEQIRRERGPEFVRQLAEILRRLEEEGHFNRFALPDEPTAPPQTIGKDPLLLVLERQAEPAEGSTVRLWQFSATTVAGIPEMHARLEELAQLAEPAGPVAAPAQSAQPEQAEEINRLRSPYHLVEYFLVKVADAEKDAAAFADAMKCLDFSLVPKEEIEEKGPEYVDDLALIIARLREQDKFDREELEKEPGPDLENRTIGADPFLLILTRQADGRWRFSAATVQRIPEMAEALRALAEQESAEGEPSVALAPQTMRLDTSSPRATLNLFLASMNGDDLATAVRCLDLSSLNENEREVADVLAGKLLMVLRRYRVIVLQDVDNDPEGIQAYTLLKHTAGRIEIDRLRSGDRAGEWLFTAATVCRLRRRRDIRGNTLFQRE